MAKAKVLVLDDEKDILNIIERFFSRKAIVDIETCTSPIQAVSMIKSGSYDLLLTDIMMPEMNGIEVLKEVKQSKPRVKVVMMTAFSTLDKILECEQLGATDYVTKPFISLRDVESKVLGALGL
jgi:DNA-binding NtrC family response regulator